MSMCERQTFGASTALAVVSCVAWRPRCGRRTFPTLGSRLLQPMLAAWDISIGPDGAGLPPGGGTPAQGAVVYAQKCSACHGDKGEGKTNTRLVGGQITGPEPAVKTVGSYWPYATTLFDFIRRAMPWTEPGKIAHWTRRSLRGHCVHILRLNATSSVTTT